MKQNWNHFAEL